MPLLVLLAFAAPVHAQSSDRSVGPTDRRCNSSLVLGYSACGATAKASAPTPSASSVPKAPPPEVRPPSGLMESEIDAYIVNHGKPSREAARALLDPSDENIAAMARRVRQDAAVAAYVAGRMTSLQEIDPGLVAVSPSFNSEDLPWLAGMRVVLHVSIGCQSCEAAAMVLQRLVAESPVLDARVVMHGAADPRALTLELGRLGITLPAVAATPAMVRLAREVPIAVVADTRRSREGVTKEFSSTQALRNAIANFRRQGSDPAKSIQGAQ